MTNTILLKRSSASNSVPSTGNLIQGELALNYADGNLFYKDASDNVVLLTSRKLVNVTGNISGNNVIATTSGTFGNITISSSNINSDAGLITLNSDSSDVDFSVNGSGVANIFYVDAGIGTVSIGNSTQIDNVILALNATTSMLVPVGNTDQRPGTAQVGMLRFNTITDTVEFYTDAEGWKAAAPPFTLISSETFSCDGATFVFTLSDSQTADSCIVSINGIVQIPGTAYTISGTTLTFAGPPDAGETVEVRALTTTSTVSQIKNFNSSAVIGTDDVAGIVNITGNLIPTGNVTQTLGNATNYWQSLYVGGNTIHLGSLQLKAISDTEFGVFTADGVTTADLDVGNIDVGALVQGTSTIGISGLGGNAYVTVGGVSNVALFTTDGVLINGTIDALGNVSASNIETTGNLAVDGTGLVTGNLQAGNITTALITTVEVTTGNVNAGNVIATDLVRASGLIITGDVSVGQLDTAQLSLSEIGYGGDPGNAAIIWNTDNIEFVYGTTTSKILKLTSTGAEVTGNISSGNVAVTGNVDTYKLSVDNDASIGNNLVVTGDISGNYITAAGNIATGNLIAVDTIYGLNLSVSSSVDSTTVTATGNVNGGNINGNVFATTGNITTVNATTVNATTINSNVVATTGNITTVNATTLNGTNTILSGDIDASTGTIDTLDGTTATFTTGNITTVNGTTLNGTNAVLSGDIDASTGTIDTLDGTTATFTTGNITTVNATLLNGTNAVLTANVNAVNLIASGLASLSSITKTGTNGVGNIGSADNTFNTVFAKATSSLYADVSEKYLADAAYESGTVLSFGGDAEVTLANEGDTRIAGVVTTNPSYIMNSGLTGDNVITVALLGRVPCKVIGPITKGSMLISGGNGYAVACATPSIGTVIGKALEHFNGRRTGIIEVVVGKI